MKVFVDTSALLALSDESDPMHLAAARTLGELHGVAQLATHNYVLVEAITLVRRRLGQPAETYLLDSLLPIIDTIWIDEATHRASVAGYRAAGRSASIVDHVAFEVMRAEGITYAWAYGTDFEDAGFGLPPRAAQGDRPKRLRESSAPYGSNADASELVSVAEIAARSGRSPNTVQSWRRRHRDFPRPVATLAAAPVWSWSDVAAWIDARNPERTPLPTN